MKWLALLFMIIDHIGFLFENYIPYNIYAAFRILGRLSFPLYVYALSLGVQKTSNIKNYLFRILTLAVISEIILKILLRTSQLNVLFAFSLYIFIYILVGKIGELDFLYILPLLVSIYLLRYVEYEYSGLFLFFNLLIINKLNMIETHKQITALILICLSFAPDIIIGRMPSYQLFASVSSLFMFTSKLNKRVFSKKTEDIIFYLSYPLHWILLTFIKTAIDLR